MANVKQTYTSAGNVSQTDTTDTVTFWRSGDDKSKTVRVKRGEVYVNGKRIK